MNDLLAWLRQPTTVAGIAASLGTVSAWLMGQMTAGQAVPLLIGAATSMLLPDNTGASQAAVATTPSISAPPGKP